MSDIPYIFETPTPSDFRKNGWFKCDNTLKFVTWAFSKCSTKEREVVHDGKKILLKPYQFIFGRHICSLETNMSEDEVRTQQKIMENSGFLKKIPNSTPNRFTMYEWLVENFTQCKPPTKSEGTEESAPNKTPNKKPIHNTPRNDFENIDPQQKTQQTPNKPPTNPHNLEERSKNKDPSPPNPSSIKKVAEEGDNSKKSIEFSEFCSTRKLPFTKRTLFSLFKKHPQATLNVVMEFDRRKPENRNLHAPDAWLKKNVIQESEFLEEKSAVENWQN